MQFFFTFYFESIYGLVLISHQLAWHFFLLCTVIFQSVLEHGAIYNDLL